MIIISKINHSVNYNTDFTPVSPFLLASNNRLAISLTPLTCNPSSAVIFQGGSFSHLLRFSTQAVDAHILTGCLDTSSINGVWDEQEDTRVPRRPQPGSPPSGGDRSLISSSVWKTAQASSRVISFAPDFLYWQNYNAFNSWTDLS